MVGRRNLLLYCGKEREVTVRGDMELVGSKRREGTDANKV